MTRRHLLTLVASGGAATLVPPLVARAQDQAPNRREVAVTVGDSRFAPEQVEVVQDDLVRITLRSTDLTHSFNVDEYRIARRIPAGGTTVVEFRADRVGTFPFYCNISSEPGHGERRGQLIVRPR